MRIKINAKDYGLGKLEFGKIYYLAYAGATYGECFTFTRKNKILMEPDKCETFGPYWISKRELKQLITGGFIHFMGELSFEEYNRLRC